MHCQQTATTAKPLRKEPTSLTKIFRVNSELTLVEITYLPHSVAYQYISCPILIVIFLALDLGEIFGKKSGLSGLRINTQSYRKSISHADRIRQLLSVATHTKLRSHRHRDKDKCEDRCMVHPINRYSCGKARSRETCSDKNCCWDPNTQMCFKQVCRYPYFTLTLFFLYPLLYRENI